MLVTEATDFQIFKSSNFQIEMALTNEQIQNKLVEKFGEGVSSFSEPYGMLTFEATKDLNLKVLQFLFDDETLKFRFLTLSNR